MIRKQWYVLCIYMPTTWCVYITYKFPYHGGRRQKNPHLSQLLALGTRPMKLPGGFSIATLDFPKEMQSKGLKRCTNKRQTKTPHFLLGKLSFQFVTVDEFCSLQFSLDGANSAIARPHNSLMLHIGWERQCHWRGGGEPKGIHERRLPQFQACLHLKDRPKPNKEIQPTNFSTMFVSGRVCSRLGGGFKDFIFLPLSG